MENRIKIRHKGRFTIEYKSDECHIEFYVEPIDDGVILDPNPEKILFNRNCNIEKIVQQVYKKLQERYENVRIE